MSGVNVMLFRSTDAGAPTLSGTVGSVIAILDACLKDGYNSKAVTITRVGTTATAACATAHGYAADGLTKVNHSGAAQAEYNGDFKIFNVTTLTYDFTVTGTPATPATGTITAKVAPIGWTKPFSGTNKGVYRSNESTATKMYLRVDDNNPNADTNQTSALRGYEIMTDIDTGIGPFPNVAQMATGIFLNKSYTTGSAVRKWVLVGDGYSFHFFYAQNVNYPDIYRQFFFGDIASEMASDPYGCLIYGDTISSPTSNPENGQGTYIINASGLTTAQTGHYMARAYGQTGSSIGVGKLSSYSLNSTTVFGNGPIPFPSPQNNGLYVAPVLIGDPSNIIRGQIKSIYYPLHSRPLGHGGVSSNFSAMPGHTLYAVATANSANIPGETHVDITGPWR